MARVGEMWVFPKIENGSGAKAAGSKFLFSPKFFPLALVVALPPDYLTLEPG